MSLLAIKGIYENGQIILEENFVAKKPMKVVVTFLEEKAESFNSVAIDDAENELQWQVTLEQAQPKLEQLALAALQQAKQGKTIKIIC